MFGKKECKCFGLTFNPEFDEPSLTVSRKKGKRGAEINTFGTRRNFIEIEIERFISPKGAN